MSMKGSLLRTVLTKAIKNDWPAQETLDFSNEILGCVEWDEDWTINDIIGMAQYMATQRSGLYGGLTQSQISDWFSKQ